MSLVALDLVSLRPRWEKEVPPFRFLAPRAGVLWLAEPKALQAYDLGDGSPRQRVPWTKAVDGLFGGDEALLIESRGSLFALGATGERVQMRYSLRGGRTYSGAADVTPSDDYGTSKRKENRLVLSFSGDIANVDGTLFHFDPIDGRMEWSLELTDTWDRATIRDHWVDGDRLFVLAGKEKGFQELAVFDLVRLREANQRRRWWRNSFEAYAAEFRSMDSSTKQHSKEMLAWHFPERVEELMAYDGWAALEVMREANVPLEDRAYYYGKVLLSEGRAREASASFVESPRGEATDGLVELLWHRDPAVRADALGGLAGREAGDVFRRVAVAKGYRVYPEGAAFAASRPQELGDLLPRALASRELYAYQAAVAALRSLAPAEVFDLCAGFLVREPENGKEVLRFCLDEYPNGILGQSAAFVQAASGYLLRGPDPAIKKRLLPLFTADFTAANLPVLVGAFVSEPDSELRTAIAEALAFGSGPDLAEAIILCYNACPQASIRIKLISALAKAGGETADGFLGNLARFGPPEIAAEARKAKEGGR